MEYRLFRNWPQDRAEAHQFMADLAPRIRFESLRAEPRTIAAVDTDYGVGGELLFASAVVMSYPEGVELERSFHHGPVSFPYHPGMFFFREGPIIVEALSKLTSEVDLLMLRGHGMAHPQFCGLACHLGYIFDRPSIGCARKLLIGVHHPVGESAGSAQPIVIGDREVGLAYRSRAQVKPIFISPGHRCDLSTSREIVVRSLREFRLPEPLRTAHLLANRYRRRMEQVDARTVSDFENE